MLRLARPESAATRLGVEEEKGLDDGYGIAQTEQRRTWETAGMYVLILVADRNGNKSREVVVVGDR